MLLLWIEIAILFCLWLTQVNSRYWLIQGLRAQLVQLACIALILAAMICLTEYSLAQKGVILILTGIALYYTSSQILPFTCLAQVEVGSSSTSDIVCLTSNVRMKNRNYDRLLQLIQKQVPDLILLTEVDGQWLDRLKALEGDYPHYVQMPQDNTYGIALYSKYELTNTAIKFLVDSDVPSIHAQIILPNTQSIQFLGLHPMPPAPHTIEENKDMELILAAALTNKNILPTIVCGDLNDVAWSPTTTHFKHISKLLDPRVGRGFFSTYNVYVPGFRMPIDHFFVSKHFSVSKIEKSSSIGSDHFPISISLKLNS